MFADRIGQTKHKITCPKNASVGGTSTVSTDVSQSEAIPPKHILLLVQEWWTLKDILILTQVNRLLYHFFNSLSLRHHFWQYKSLTLTNASVLQWHFIHGNWSRYTHLSKLCNFITWNFRAHGTPFDKLPTNNVYMYQGYSFMMNNTAKLRVIVFNWDKTQGKHVGEYDNGWLKTLKLRQRIDLLVIDANPLAFYPYYIKANIIMFENSHCHVNSMVNSIIRNDSSVIIFQRCVLCKRELKYDPIIQSVKNKTKKRSIVFSDMYQWVPMWRICVRNSAIFDYNFANILYQGIWDTVIKKKSSPIELIEQLTGIGKPYWSDNNHPHFCMLFTSKPNYTSYANKLQYAKDFFNKLSAKYEQIIQSMKYYNAFVIGICQLRVDGQKCGFVFNLKNTIDKKQIKEYQKKWMNVLKADLKLEKDDFERESQYIKNLCQM